jgi:polyhydroxyalkanoate synthesis regulator phasin
MAKHRAESTLSIPFIDDIGEVVGKLRKDVEAAVERAGKKAVGMLPKSSRKQVDSVIDRIDEVRGGVNKRVDTLSADIRKRFKIVQGTIDKRVTSLRKETDTRRKQAVSAIEKEARKRVEVMFKWLSLPVRTDIEAVKRRLTALERRLDAIEKEGKGQRAA